MLDANLFREPTRDLSTAPSFSLKPRHVRRRCGADLAAMVAEEGTDDKFKWVSRATGLKVPPDRYAQQQYVEFMLCDIASPFM